MTLERVHAEESDAGASRIRVRVRAGGEEGEGVARRGGGRSAVRVAAEATLEAVRSALGPLPELGDLDGDWVIIDGVDVVLLARRRPGREGREPLGMARSDGDASRSAAAAVLDAVNRLLRRGG